MCSGLTSRVVKILGRGRCAVIMTSDLLASVNNINLSLLYVINNNHFIDESTAALNMLLCRTCLNRFSWGNYVKGHVEGQRTSITVSRN